MIHNTGLGWFDLNMSLDPAGDGANSVQGLLGRNAGAASVYNMPDGEIISQRLSDNELLGFYADAWRVTPEDTLFSGKPSAAEFGPATTSAAPSAGLEAVRTSFAGGAYEIATSGIAGEPYDSSFAFYGADKAIETEVFVKNGAAYAVENWNADGSVLDYVRLNDAGAPFGVTNAIDLKAFSAKATLGYQEDASGGFGLLTVSQGPKTLTLRLDGLHDASEFALASDGGGARVSYAHA